jgi:hypothetical protein
MDGMEGDQVKVKGWNYSVSGGTDAEFEFSVDGGDDIKCELKFEKADFLPAKFTNGAKDIPWEFLKATWGNFFKREFNFSSEATIWTSDGKVLCCKIFPTVLVEDDYSGENEWPDVVITMPLAAGED